MKRGNWHPQTHTWGARHGGRKRTRAGASPSRGSLRLPGKNRNAGQGKGREQILPDEPTRPTPCFQTSGPQDGNALASAVSGTGFTVLCSGSPSEQDCTELLPNTSHGGKGRNKVAQHSGMSSVFHTRAGQTQGHSPGLACTLASAFLVASSQSSVQPRAAAPLLPALPWLLSAPRTRSQPSGWHPWPHLPLQLHLLLSVTH